VTRSETVVLRSASSLKKGGGKPPPGSVGIFGIFGFYSLPIRRAAFSDSIQARGRLIRPSQPPRLRLPGLASAAPVPRLKTGLCLPSGLVTRPLFSASAPHPRCLRCVRCAGPAGQVEPVGLASRRLYFFRRASPCKPKVLRFSRS
jgi:hypothetical protein